MVDSDPRLQLQVLSHKELRRNDEATVSRKCQQIWLPAPARDPPVPTS